MASFRVVLMKHGYASVERVRSIIMTAGGELIDTETLSESEAMRLCEDADGILVRWFKMTAERMKRLRRCKIILRCGVGTDNVDVDAATEAGIMVGHVPNYCWDEVSTHAIALLLGCVRKVAALDRKLKGGGWNSNPVYAMGRMRGRTLGLVGLGNIGKAVARKMAGWNLRILATDPYVEAERAEALGVELVDLETLCRESDYISLHVPLLPETHHLISWREICWMRPGVILINTARGPVLDGAALWEAIKEGRVGQAGLDVFEQEPLGVESPLRGDERVTLTDHIAWYSEESEAELKQTAAEEVARVCTGGLPRSLANPEVLKRLGRFEEWSPNETARWQLKRLEMKGGS